jgi:transcription elongation factor Elf1
MIIEFRTCHPRVRDIILLIHTTSSIFSEEETKMTGISTNKGLQSPIQMEDNTMNNKKTAIYCRMACADTEQIERQEEMLLKFAGDNGYGECACYRDNGESGMSLDRPGMQRLKDDIRAGKIHTVIVYNLSRISRNALHFNDWYQLLKRHRVGFLSVLEKQWLNGDGSSAMSSNKNNCCPLCRQLFSLADGLSADAFLAKNIITRYAEMQSKDENEKTLPCPRCGQYNMNMRNALSRQADINVCSVCGMREAIMAEKGESYPLESWWIVSVILKNGERKSET